MGGISASIRRLEDVEFTNYIYLDHFVALYSIYSDPWVSLQNVILPFEMKIWIYLIGAVFVTSFILFIAITKTESDVNIQYGYMLQVSYFYINFNTRI